MKKRALLTLLLCIPFWNTYATDITKSNSVIDITDTAILLNGYSNRSLSNGIYPVFWKKLELKSQAMRSSTWIKEKSHIFYKKNEIFTYLENKLWVEKFKKLLLKWSIHYIDDSQTTETSQLSNINNNFFSENGETFSLTWVTVESEQIFQVYSHQDIEKYKIKVALVDKNTYWGFRWWNEAPYSSLSFYSDLSLPNIISAEIKNAWNKENFNEHINNFTKSYELQKYNYPVYYNDDWTDASKKISKSGYVFIPYIVFEINIKKGNNVISIKSERFHKTVSNFSGMEDNKKSFFQSSTIYYK